MVNFNEARQTVVLYTCGICNLNCRYCTIDKNPALKEIDDVLEESFKGDYYFNRIKEYFPRKDQLKCIETWGGEPFLRMDRIYPLIHKVIDYYPCFEKMFSSTNFSYDEWLDKFLGLMNIFGEYPNRDFKYSLQLSVDGPKYINDANRGEGVTERCIKNFDRLVAAIKDGEFPSNVELNITLKGTWDLDCIKKLNSKEKLIEFFQFYENNYHTKIHELNMPNITIYETIPNTAVPAPTTKRDGEIFAELVQKCREIEKENIEKQYFKYYTKITPFTGNPCQKEISYQGTCIHNCGSGSSMLGLLPYNMVSACHEGFTLMAEKYKEYANTRSDKNLSVSLNTFMKDNPVPMCMTDDGYIIHERKMACYNNTNQTAQFTSEVGHIMALAMAGQIDPIYISEYEALKAATYMCFNSSYCIKANYAITGSFLLEPDDLYKLYLNGALPYLTEDGIWYDNDEMIGDNCNGQC